MSGYRREPNAHFLVLPQWSVHASDTRHDHRLRCLNFLNIYSILPITVSVSFIRFPLSVPLFWPWPLSTSIPEIKTPRFEPAYVRDYGTYHIGDQQRLSDMKKYGSRQRVRPKIRHLAPLDGCAYTFKEDKNTIISWHGSFLWPITTVNPLRVRVTFTHFLTFLWETLIFFKKTISSKNFDFFLNDLITKIYCCEIFIIFL